MRSQRQDQRAWTLPELLANGDTTAYEPESREDDRELLSPFAAPGGFSVDNELENWADTLRKLPTQVNEALRKGNVPLAVQLLVAGGKRDENWLTDLVFHFRHPELHGRDIRPGETKLAGDWVELRTKFVRPLLAAAGAPPAAIPQKPPSPPFQGQPRLSPADWRHRALTEAGIDPNTWKPVDGFEKLRSVCDKVYAFYAKIYLQEDKNMRWAGLAKLAGGEILYALRTSQALIDFAKSPPVLSVDKGFAVLPSVAAAYAGELQVLVLEGQKAVFWDLAWQMQAYVTAGLPELEAQRAAGADVPIEAWRDMASGDEDRIWRGTAGIAHHEQEIVLGPFFKAVRDIQDFDRIPAQMSATARSPVPGGKPFAEVLPDGDITVFADRWRWIEADMLPAYRRLTPQRRRQLVRLPLADLADHRYPPE
ncbi:MULTISPECIES: hypothetical protein [Amycolatopsis]|uniref:Uncharacterized protein n=1 Tax=Amycolatopsis dongchuanensis TaxID=1070866 RepID=A0ABP9QPN7_9PSEU|nr:hypothetical protein [Amycolatopsis sacchari]